MVESSAEWRRRLSSSPAPFYFAPLPTIWTPGTGYPNTVPCVSVIASCNLPWLIGTKHFPESKTRSRIQNFFGFWEVFWILGSVLDSGTCFVPTSHRSIPERRCSLKFCNTFQLNSDLLLTWSSLTFQTFLEFLSSHTVDVSLKEAVNQRIHTLLVSLWIK